MNRNTTITFSESDISENYRHLYLYNVSTQQYDRVNFAENGKITVYSPGRYMLTTERLRTGSIPLYLLIVGGSVLAAGIAAYIVIKKKYWFW